MAKVTKEMMIGEVVSKFPESAEILMKNGLHCIGCHVAAFESLEQGFQAHGMEEKKIDEVMKEINEKLE